MTPSAIKIWMLSLEFLGQERLTFYILWNLTPFVLISLIFSLSFQCLSSFHDHSQTANPLNHCCQFKVIKIANRLPVFPQGSQIESPTGTNRQGRQFDPSCIVFTFICRTMIIRSSYKGIMKFSPTLTIVILTGINKCFKMLNTCPVPRE